MIRITEFFQIAICSGQILFCGEAEFQYCYRLVNCLICSNLVNIREPQVYELQFHECLLTTNVLHRNKKPQSVHRENVLIFISENFFLGNLNVNFIQVFTWLTFIISMTIHLMLGS